MGESKVDNFSTGNFRSDPIYCSPGVKFTTPAGVYMKLLGDISFLPAAPVIGSTGIHLTAQVPEIIIPPLSYQNSEPSFISDGTDLWQCRMTTGMELRMTRIDALRSGRC
jgi:hypothetical protein